LVASLSTANVCRAVIKKYIRVHSHHTYAMQKPAANS
jgi:hypothetical protein